MMSSFVSMVMCGWPMAPVPVKAEWRCVFIIPGEQSAIMNGTIEMEMSFVVN